jgi:hypothetical protein
MQYIDGSKFSLIIPLALNIFFTEEHTTNFIHKHIFGTCQLSIKSNSEYQFLEHYCVFTELYNYSLPSFLPLKSKDIHAYKFKNPKMTFTIPYFLSEEMSDWVWLCRSVTMKQKPNKWNWSSILLLVANGHQICIKYTNSDLRLRTPDDGQKGCPKHVES